MRINPGGRLNIADVVGRDQDVERYWSILKRQGLILSAERRIGKTHVALKMLAEPRPGFLPFYQDLEGVHSIRELIYSLYKTVEGSLSTSDRWKARFAKWSLLVPTTIAGIDTSAIKDNWPSLLDRAFEDLGSIADGDLVVVMWDEFPLMLYNIARSEGEAVAIKLLDQLRALRQRHSSSIRFVFTGSIGLHLVVRSLHRAGNANDPTNDMYAATVPPLVREEALGLTKTLLQETTASPENISALAAAIVAKVEGFPYYLHHVVDQLQQLNRPPIDSDISSAIDALIYDSQDVANFRYYVSRIETYYDEAERIIAFATLDAVCSIDGVVDITTLINLVRHRVTHINDEDVQRVVGLLVEDHYLTRNRVGTKMGLQFRWQLVKRWWKESRT